MPCLKVTASSAGEHRSSSMACWPWPSGCTERTRAGWSNTRGSAGRWGGKVLGSTG